MFQLEENYTNKYAIECDNIISEYYRKKGWQLIKSTTKEDLQYGIDYFLYEPGKNIPYTVDMKNTVSLYFLNLNLKYNKIYARSPFTKNTKATHYFFINTLNLVPIRSHLEKYINDVEKFISIINKIEYKNINEAMQLYSAKSINQLCLLIKMELMPLLKKNILISYEKDKYTVQDKISFRLYER